MQHLVSAPQFALAVYFHLSVYAGLLKHHTGLVLPKYIFDYTNLFP